MFRVRGHGDEGFYSRDRDFLFIFPEILVRGAIMAMSKESFANTWLISTGVPEDAVESLVRTTLGKVLELCKSEDDFSKAHSDLDINPEVYQAILMGVGCVIVPVYHKTANEHQVRTRDAAGNVKEMHLNYEVETLLKQFDKLREHQLSVQK